MAIGEVDDAIAAFRFVHVVGGNQNGHAFEGEVVDFVPEVPPGLRVHACRGLIQQEELWIVHRDGCQCEALLPATRKCACQLALAIGQTQLFECLVHGFAQVRQAVEARHEFEVFADGHVAPEREFLGHVAGLLPDQCGVALDVIAEALA